MATTAPIKRIGILTGGGDCPGLNAVIRAVTKCAILQHGWEVWGIEDGFLGLIENRIHRLEAQHVSNILSLGGTILGTSNKADPSRFAVGKDESGKVRHEDVTSLVLRNIARRQLDVIVVVGGDGTMSGAANLVRHGVRCIGIPKTIDNDLTSTEMTFGFMTAVEIATEALDRIHTTASSHHRVMLVETMGRNAGWLNLWAGMAGGADVILIPEIPYSIESVCAACQERSRHDKKFTIIAVSEGAKPRGGKQVVDRVVHDSPDPIRLGGVSEVLADDISRHTGLETRATILGHVQRGGTPCAFDRVLATQFAMGAMRLLANSQFDQLVVMQQGKLSHAPIVSAADKQRYVPADDPMLQSARDLGICVGD